MYISKGNPVIEFLMKEENLPNVLEIIRHGEEIREMLARQFWEGLESEIKTSRPRDLTYKFLWDEAWKKETKPNVCFRLSARLTSVGEKTQGLEYAIEAYPTYYGIGLRRIDKNTNVEKLSTISFAVTLRDELLKTRQGMIESEPQEWWLWFENWDKDPYDDPWIWFAKKSASASSFIEAAEKFWNFVRATYPLVLQINEAANNPNKTGKV